MLTRGLAELAPAGVRPFTQGINDELGIRHEASLPEPWIIAMDCVPARVSVLGYAARWSIEPLFSDSRAGTLARRTRILDMRTTSEQRPLLVMSLAMHWCVRVDRDDALHSPSPLETKRKCNLQEALVHWHWEGKLANLAPACRRPCQWAAALAAQA